MYWKCFSAIWALSACTLMSCSAVTAEKAPAGSGPEPSPATEQDGELQGDGPETTSAIRQAGERWLEPALDGAFRFVPPGSYLMGSPEDEPGRHSTEVAHEVTLTRGLWMGETEVTQQQWQQIMGGNPSRFDGCGPTCPVDSVTWIEAVEFSNALSKRAGLTECYELETTGINFVGLDCDGYRLPSEAEWEWAARAATKTPLYNGELTIVGAGHGPELDAIAWYGGNSGVEYEGGEDCSAWKETHHPASWCGTHPVALKEPNPWGLHDMLGNVWEWTWDGTGTFAPDAVVDPLVGAKQSGRMVRGCAWDSGAKACRIANRGMNTTRIQSPVIGLRVVRTASSETPVCYPPGS